MKKMVLSALAMLALSGCANRSFDRDGFAAGMLMIHQGLQQRAQQPTNIQFVQPHQFQQPQRRQDEFQPVFVDPQRGTQYCNAQGLCVWK